MKKRIKAVAFAIIVFCCLQAKSQTGWRMGISLNPGYATNSIYGFTLGSDIRVQKNLGTKNFFLLTTGITHFFDTEKTIDGFTYVPLKAGIKTYLAKHVYIAGELGAGFGLNKGSDASFLWSPSFGYSGKKIDISIKYEDFTEGDYTKQVALRFAYGFKL